MAVANTFTFGGVSTSAYGLVVEGPGDYSAPKRAVDTIEIPGRNGAFQLDKGYYENIELEYKVVVKEATQDDFLDSIDAFRNAIVSQIGYQRLEDTYHPGEYRMAMYSGGLDEDPQFHGNGAVFKVNFDCKPQRFLTSGETAVSVDSGDTLTNPTLFEASPLLAVKGYGNIGFNGYEIDLENEEVGHLTLAEAGNTSYYQKTLNYASMKSLIASGDTITLSDGFYWEFPVRVRAANDSITQCTLGSISGTIPTYTKTLQQYQGDTSVKYLRLKYAGDYSFIYGGTAESYTDTFSITVKSQIPGGSEYTTTFNGTVTFSIRKGPTSCYVLMKLQFSKTGSDGVMIPSAEMRLYYGSLTCESTKSVLGDPTYIDCDLGEAYKLEDDVPVSLNAYIDLGSKLPILAVGENEITFDNTFTEVKIAPRWWRV